MSIAGVRITLEGAPDLLLLTGIRMFVCVYVSVICVI